MRPNEERMALRSRKLHDEGHEVIHELRWVPNRMAPMTLCRQYTMRDPPTLAMQDRNADLIVNCLGCLAELED